MPYYPMKDGKYVFLHSQNYTELSDIALSEKSDDWRFNSNIQGRKECEEANKLRHKAINELYKATNFEDFYKEWIYFKLEGDDAIEDLPFLLYDYGCLNKHFFFERYYTDLKTGMPLNTTNKVYKIAIVNHSTFKAQADILFSTLLDTSKIRSIEGELNSFSIEMEDYFFIFHKAVNISPKL
jgi:hypothetical protein